MGFNPIFSASAGAFHFWYKRVRFPLQANLTFAYFQMATDYTAALDLVEYFQDCQNGGEILDTIDAVFETNDDN